MKLHAKSIACGCGLLFLIACGDQELILPGERLQLRGDEPLATRVLENQVVPHRAGSAVASRAWTHLGGNPQHSIAHPALAPTLSLQWSQTIGSGNAKRSRITATPIVANETIYMLDSQATVTATSTTGNRLWSADVTPLADSPEDAFGGGLAYANGRLFVTTGFGEMTALDASSGQELWSQKFESSVPAAPTATDNLVFAVSRNELGWALDAETGQILWQVLGTSAGTGVAGGASPAIAGNLAIFPFASGQLVAASRDGGAVRWSGSVAGERIGRAFSRISDLTGAPVVTGGRIYAGNHAGHVAAFDEATGALQWSADFGAIGTLWVSGGSVFLVSDENRLVRLDAASGEAIWAIDLPFFTRTRLSRRKGTFAHYGPVLAGGRLLVPSDEGIIRQFDPESGAELGVLSLPSGAASNPVVVDQTLYIVTENGQLHAFR